MPLRVTSTKIACVPEWIKVHRGSGTLSIRARWVKVPQWTGVLQWTGVTRWFDVPQRIEVAAGNRVSRGSARGYRNAQEDRCVLRARAELLPQCFNGGRSSLGHAPQFVNHLEACNR